jgi:hypothetical protein
MNRPAMIAGTAAGAAVLAAAAIAGVALVRAGQGTPPESTVAIAPSTVAVPNTVESLPPVPSMPAMPAPPSPAVGRPTTASGDESASVEPVTRTIGKAAARDAVLAQTSGSVLNVARMTHQGTPAWAVTIGRSDGSIVTGYVDTIGGVVFDWTVERSAQSNTGGGRERGEDGEYEGGEHESGEGSDD